MRKLVFAMRYSFADCVLDTGAHRVVRGGVDVPVEPQVFDLLRLLAENAGQLVSKDHLIDVVWGGRIVSEATISARINAARKAVGDDGKRQAIIRTITRRGFEMVAEVVTEGSATREAGQPAGDARGDAGCEAGAEQEGPEQRQTIRFTTSRDGTGIAYAISGEGPPLLRAGHFLSHLEVDWQGSVFRPFLHALGRVHRLVRYDMRGMGLSDSTPGALDLERYCDDLLAVADAAGLERFPILGISQGVPVAVRFAAMHPERVSRLVLYGGFAQGRMVREGGATAEEAEAMLTMIKAGWGKPDSAFMAAFTAIFCPDATPEERASLVATQQASATPEMALQLRQVLDRMDVTEWLPQVSAPTLVIHASNDAVNPLSQGRFLASRIANAELKVLETNNHIFVQSCPSWAEFVAATLAFLERSPDR
ncbi:alpha/beta fold hydrolase [Rhodobacteraceae bacterium D3-12]|nr:alpha/beta fold hydrolase [Rhodobacteraceae bacterium D3-12]